MMRSIVSFELDDDCILLNIFNDNSLFLRESIHLSHIRITLFQFDHWICLLNRLGSHLCSLTVNIMFDSYRNVHILSEIESVNNIS
jgi:hypothetical protein